MASSNEEAFFMPTLFLQFKCFYHKEHNDFYKEHKVLWGE